ncbi:MAG: hydrogenase 3 maturation endopeptidase HyCI [candidate division WOR-3 bacterium]
MVIILGIGNRLRGDDGVGSIIAEELKKYERENFIVYDCETTPENYIEKVISGNPRWIIFIDACNFNAPAGTFKIFEETEISQITSKVISTHTLPITVLIALIKRSLPKARISLIGVQPKRLNFCNKLSNELNKTKAKIIDFILKNIKNVSFADETSYKSL